MVEHENRSMVLPDWLDQSLSFWHGYRIALVEISVIIIIFLVRRRRTASPTKTSTSDSLSARETPTWIKEKEKSEDTGTTIEKVRPPTSVTSNTNAKKSKPAATRVVTGRKPNAVKTPATIHDNVSPKSIQPWIFYASLMGTTEALSREVATQIQNTTSSHTSILEPKILDISYIDLDDYFISGPKQSSTQSSIQHFYILLIPSYDIDSILNNFLDHLDETHNDFRIDTAPMASLSGYTVFGVGDKSGWPSEEKGFCSQAIEVDKWMAKLTGRKRAYPLGLGDVKSNMKEAAYSWTDGLCSTLMDISTTGSLGVGVSGSGDAVESGDEEEEATEDFPDLGRKKRQKRDGTVDVEDVGENKTKSSSTLAIDFTTYAASNGLAVATVKAMVPRESPTHAALTKQGYTIVGTHSGVKICRWTKSALRGRGSCYKNSFYGIASHLCMETTPSLSCSNKCVFCWRHGTNPVSTTWRWQVDDPQMIFNGAKEGHYKKIKMMRGVPGVRSERFEEAMRIRHCALSLVGEPIFYPRINEFLDLLHGEKISSFLVCNAQHPQQLRDLKRVTQLYVSIDASNRESLRKIDRPLHRDFWERFQACLDILREKRFVQRTVFRLTLVKGFNVEDEVEGYADLVQKGLPCFVEVKGVTYCGTTTAAGAGLTMQNVPFYEEVVEFVEALDKALAKRGLEYGIAAEHAHSCCILLASKRFHIDNRWRTIIDYERFFELLEAGGDFAPEDYCRETPEWALWGNGGFDPRDERVDRKGRPKDKPAEVKPLEKAPVVAIERRANQEQLVF